MFPKLNFNIDIIYENNNQIDFKIDTFLHHEKTNTTIKYSYLTKEYFSNILNTKTNILKIVSTKNKSYNEYYIVPELLINFLFNYKLININIPDNYKSSNISFNKNINLYLDNENYININGNIGINIINKCYEMFKYSGCILIQPIIIINNKYINVHKIVNNIIYDVKYYDQYNNNNIMIN